MQSTSDADDKQLRDALIDLVHRHAASIADPAARLSEALGDAPEWSRASECLREHADAARHIGNLVGTADCAGRCEVDGLLLGFLQYVRQSAGMVTRSTVDDIAVEFLSFLRGNTITREWRSPAFGVTGEPSEHRLTDRTRLVILDGQHGLWEMARLLGQESIDAIVSRHTWHCVAFLVTQHIDTKLIGEQTRSSARRANHVLTGYDCARQESQLFVEACRVVAPCCVATPFLCSEPAQWLAEGRGIHQSPHGIPWQSIWRTLAIDRQIAAAIGSYMQAISQLNRDSSLRRALTWYCKGCDQIDYGDRLIAHAIAAESLFLNDGERGEILYRLRQRIALTLGATVDERYALHREVADIYGTRSSIVHGSHSEPTKVEGHD